MVQSNTSAAVVTMTTEEFDRRLKKHGEEMLREFMAQTSTTLNMPHLMCMKPPVLRIEWLDSDPNRRFHGCVKDEGGSDFKLWEDPLMCYKSRMVILELRNRCDKLEVEILELSRVAQPKRRSGGAPSLVKDTINPNEETSHATRSDGEPLPKYSAQQDKESAFPPNNPSMDGRWSTNRLKKTWSRKISDPIYYTGEGRQMSLNKGSTWKRITSGKARLLVVTTYPKVFFRRRRFGG
ncbi:hypothetical protein BUALT_Bualt17G0066700 [Buddleja alternifolia]|uniref:Uncharacterized protein n=1 Tax=Buddleja alternifolia TaxID=168488 RepID=A0AAV6W6K3_9LAMI|nr:hypothetical protein BUALT_Bualt17G0066700 [Buddleja alternifolia]